MPLCPECRTDQERRVSGSCPKCGTEVQNYNGHWFRASIGSPTVSILRLFEDLMSEKLSRDAGDDVIFSIPRRGLRYKRELVAAERMLEDAYYDYDLTESAIKILFHDPQFAWKTRNSLMQLRYDFLPALAIARSRRKQEQKAMEKREDALRGALRRQEILV